MKRASFDPEPELRKMKKVKKTEAELKLKRDKDALVVLQKLRYVEDYEPLKSFEREMEQIQHKLESVKDFTVEGDPTTIGELESRLEITKSSIQHFVLNQIDNLVEKEVWIDGTKKEKIEEVVKDFRAITNKYMLKLENCKESLEGLKSGIEVFQSERLTNGNHMARRRAKWLGEKIKRSIKAAKQSAALD